MKVSKAKLGNASGKFEYLYWFIPVFLAVLQVIFMINSSGKIRTEELIDSVRSIWWFQNRLVTDGGYSNLGWYWLLTVFYNLFGFTLYGAKFAKLIIVVPALFCLAGVLKKRFGSKHAWLPLLTIGLSPTLLYFNTMQVAQFLDLPYFLICFYLLYTLNFKTRFYPLKLILAWAVAMLGWLTYQSFIYYLPILMAVYLFGLLKNSKGKGFLVKSLLVSISSFMTPLILAVMYIENRQLLLYDRIFQRGLFRSNGGFELDIGLFLNNLKLLGTDLFLYFNSYYFEVRKVEFSDFYPIIAVIFVFLAAAYMAIKFKKYRRLVLTIGLLLLIDSVLINIVGPLGLGGIRRAGVLLALFWGLFALVWDFILSRKRVQWPVKYLLIGICSLFLVHNLAVIPANLKYLQLPTPYSDTFWFKQKETPEKSLDFFVRWIQSQDLLLICTDKDHKPIGCGGYSLIDAAVKGSCYWNRLDCHTLSAYDVKMGQYVPLTFNFWANNNWDR